MTHIFTFHYVRPRQSPQFPELHVRSVEEFDAQLDLIGAELCGRLSDVVAGLTGSASNLPMYALTFDDGFSDHYTNVFPRLRSREMTGAFFPIAGASLHGRLLDVHKIQLMLAAGHNPDDLRRFAMKCLKGEGCGDLVDRLEPDVSKRATGSRFDENEVRSLKRALQAELPSPIRSEVVNQLFVEFIDEDQADIAAKLYLNIEQLREMADEGMEIGGHSVNHHHLDTLDDSELAAEIDGSLELLAAVHEREDPTADRDLVFCYPYGSHDDRVVAAVKSAGFTAAVSVAEGPVTGASDAMAIPRFDTNKLAAVVSGES